MAFRLFDNTIRLDRIAAGLANFVFDIEKMLAIETIQLETSIDPVIFYIMKAVISFLLFLTNMDRMGVDFNNVKNNFIHGNKRFPVVR